MARQIKLPKLIGRKWPGRAGNVPLKLTGDSCRATDAINRKEIETNASNNNAHSFHLQYNNHLTISAAATAAAAPDRWRSPFCIVAWCVNVICGGWKLNCIEMAFSVRAQDTLRAPATLSSPISRNYCIGGVVAMMRNSTAEIGKHVFPQTRPPKKPTKAPFTDDFQWFIIERIRHYYLTIKCFLGKCFRPNAMSERWTF